MATRDRMVVWERREVAIVLLSAAAVLSDIERYIPTLEKP